MIFDQFAQIVQCCLSCRCLMQQQARQQQSATISLTENLYRNKHVKAHQQQVLHMLLCAMLQVLGLLLLQRVVYACAAHEQRAYPSILGIYLRGCCIFYGV